MSSKPNSLMPGTEVVPTAEVVPVWAAAQQERIAKLEVKMNIIAFLSGTSVVILGGIILKLFM